MEKSSLSPDSLSFDVLGEQQKPKDDAVKNKKKNEILKEKGLHKDNINYDEYKNNRYRRYIRTN